jgi:hypothetical protein
MKKLLCLLLALGLLLSSPGAVFGLQEDWEYHVISTHVVSSGGDTIQWDSQTASGWYVSTATIGTNDFILGFTVTANTTSHGAIAALHDLPSVQTDHQAAEALMSNTTMWAELEVGADPGSATIWFEYPKKITTQLGILTSEAPATVVIYYIAS